MAKSKINKNLDCWKGTLYGLNLCSVVWENLGIKFFGKMAVKSGFILSSCGIRLSGLVSYCRWFVFFGGYGFGEKC